MEWITFEKKLNSWRKLTKNDWSLLRHHNEPPLFKLFWKFNIQIKPPYYLNLFALAVGSGTTLAIVFILFSKFTNVNEGSDMYLDMGIVGACFGAFISALSYVERRIRKLPSWDDL